MSHKKYLILCSMYNNLNIALICCCFFVLAKVEEEMRKSPLSMFDPLSKVTNLQDINLLHNG